MTKILEQLIEAAIRRGENWMNIKVKTFPDVERMTEIVMLGSHSYALINSRRRLVKEKIDLTPEVYETPSALARDYLRIEYKRGPRGTKAQIMKVEGVPPVPSYAMPRKFAMGFYVDIKSAYWDIMNVIGWDVDYNPGLWLSPGRPPRDFPFPDHKVARNCLVSAGKMSGIPRFDPRKLPGDPYDEIIRGSELKNNQLPRLIHDILNSIAVLAIEAGAVYINNDGFIAPDEKTKDRISIIIEDWGLTPRIKAQGGGQVKGSGVYQVGKVKTHNYSLNRDPSPLANIYPPNYRKWLQKEFSFFAAQGNDL